MTHIACYKLCTWHSKRDSNYAYYELKNKQTASECIYRNKQCTTESVAVVRLLVWQFGIPIDAVALKLEFDNNFYAIVKITFMKSFCLRNEKMGKRCGHRALVPVIYFTKHRRNRLIQSPADTCQIFSYILLCAVRQRKCIFLSTLDHGTVLHMQVQIKMFCRQKNVKFKFYVRCETLHIFSCRVKHKFSVITDENDDTQHFGLVLCCTRYAFDIFIHRMYFNANVRACSTFVQNGFCVSDDFSTRL